MTWRDLGIIATAWYRSLHPTPDQQALADTRLSVCVSCPMYRVSPLTKVHYCQQCGCPLHKKVFAPPSTTDRPVCPLDRWDA